MIVIKLNGSESVYDGNKVITAIHKADSDIPYKYLKEIENSIWNNLKKLNRVVTVNDIEHYLIENLISYNFHNALVNYINYKYLRKNKPTAVEQKILSLVDNKNEEAMVENSNKNPTINSVQRDYIAGEISKYLSEKFLLPQRIVTAHDKGIIHFHDLDYYIQKSHNCELVNLEDMLQNGTVISGIKIEKPHSFSTACNITTQIIAQVASNQYGGQSISLTHLAPFVDVSRKKIQKDVREEFKDLGIKASEEDIVKIVNKRLSEEIKRGIQTIQYQILTLMTTNGQAPFITVFMYLNEARNQQEKDDLAMIIEEVIKQRIEGVKNEQGVWITPSFPKLIYVLQEDNIDKGGKYYYLTELAAKCTAKRLVPDYISEKIMKELKEGNCFPVMGCRSALTPYKDESGKYKFYGRFNMGVVTLNLPDVALSSHGDYEQFYEILNDRLHLCYDALMCRYEHLKGTKSDVAPILWQHGALARLKPGETIDKLLLNGYSTLSLGYAGLWECVKFMTNKDLTDDEGMKFGLHIMKILKNACDEWTKQTTIHFGLYGTPLESTTYKFAKCLQNRFGIIEGVTDKQYITNSYHIHVTKEIDAFTKLKIESKFQKLSTGGAISYVEIPDMKNNIPAVLSVIKFIYNNIMYAELNTKSDYCQKCGFDGEIKIVKDDNNKLVWECPKCGNRDQTTMNVARRTCGSDTIGSR